MVTTLGAIYSLSYAVNIVGLSIYAYCKRKGYEGGDVLAGLMAGGLVIGLI